MMTDELKQAEKHVEEADRRGGCERNMFLGDCPECDRYYASVEYIDLAALNSSALYPAPPTPEEGRDGTE